MGVYDSDGGSYCEEDLLKKKKRIKKRVKKRKSPERSRNGDECYICHGSTGKKYYPCDCRFGPAHLKCIKKWVEEGHPKCGICEIRYNFRRERKKVHKEECTEDENTCRYGYY